MKKHFRKLGIKPIFIAFLTVVFSFSLVACGDDNKKEDEPGQIVGGDDDDDEEPSQAAKMMGFSYGIELGDFWWEFFDIKVVYNDLKGVEHKETLTKNFVISNDGVADLAPDALILNVTATPKADMPVIDPDRIYDMSQNIVWHIASSDKMLYTNSVSSTMTVAGSKLEGNKILTEERTIVDRKFDI